MAIRACPSWCGLRRTGCIPRLPDVGNSDCRRARTSSGGRGVHRPLPFVCVRGLPGPQVNGTVRFTAGSHGREGRQRRLGTIATIATTLAPGRPGGEITDHDLVRAARAGDDQAFESLYRRYQRRIAAYVNGMVHDYARAEDITQDVFISALRRMRQTDTPIAFKPWIYEIAKNACIDAFRRSKRAEEISYDADDTLGDHDGRLMHRGPAPEVAVDQKMSLEHLRGAFGGLSDAHHQ